MLPHLCAANTAFAAICVVCNQVKQSAVFAICAFMQCAHWIVCDVPCANNMESAMCAMQKHCGRSKLNQPLKKDCWWWCKIEIWRNGCDVMTASIEAVQAGTACKQRRIRAMASGAELGTDVLQAEMSGALQVELSGQVEQSWAQMCCKQRCKAEKHFKQSSGGEWCRVECRCTAKQCIYTLQAEWRCTASRALEAGGARRLLLLPLFTWLLSPLATTCRGLHAICFAILFDILFIWDLRYFILWSLFWTSLWSSIHFEHLIV